MKRSLPSKNTSQPTVRCISCQLPVCLMRFQANSAFCCRTQKNTIAAVWGLPFSQWRRAPARLLLDRHGQRTFVIQELLCRHRKWPSSPNFTRHRRLDGVWWLDSVRSCSVAVLHGRREGQGTGAEARDAADSSKNGLLPRPWVGPASFCVKEMWIPASYHVARVLSIK